MSSRRSGMQLAIRCEEVPIGVLADPSPRLLVSTSRRLRVRTASAENQALRCGNGGRLGARSRRRTALKTFPYGAEQDELLWLIMADHGQGGR